ncbi:hypothetical protein AMAG_13512 [Allomyces macrogynus ATCC 38327]|uniref:Uncharacterized protein n=1 Tax=Allomyces macrogynus (strain ATCC 38327) TaxID=578462 RepID=A0A0L0T1Z1_ALLM3|nr:hypothetical protein AMAG_13512 [Allomyces macrogynus ATCC 38327]|eukprot:KNE68873.1 hypothetical protein AMAG_13512 [Allomyces macrogynus ATCC 38327]
MAHVLRACVAAATASSSRRLHLVTARAHHVLADHLPPVAVCLPHAAVQVNSAKLVAMLSRRAAAHHLPARVLDATGAARQRRRMVLLHELAPAPDSAAIVHRVAVHEVVVDAAAGEPEMLQTPALDPIHLARYPPLCTPQTELLHLATEYSLPASLGLVMFVRHPFPTAAVFVTLPVLLDVYLYTFILATSVLVLLWAATPKRVHARDVHALAAHVTRLLVSTARGLSELERVVWVEPCDEVVDDPARVTVWADSAVRLPDVPVPRKRAASAPAGGGWGG